MTSFFNLVVQVGQSDLSVELINERFLELNNEVKRIKT